MEQWLSGHWVQIGVIWVFIQNFFKALQDAEDNQPPNLKDKPIALVSYYMGAIGGYLFTGNRVQSINKTGG